MEMLLVTAKAVNCKNNQHALYCLYKFSNKVYEIISILYFI